MLPTRIDLVGEFLALKWDDESESFVGLEKLRRACPCAHCAGETDLTGGVHRPASKAPLTEQSFAVLSLSRIGSYALSVHWGDGHQTGIYSWPQLVELGDD